MSTATKLIQEVEILKQENSEIKAALKSQETLLSQKNNHIRQLEEMLQTLRHKQFGASSEKSDKQLGLFNEAEEELSESEAPVKTDVKAHTRKSKPRVAIPADLPREQVIHDLPESEKVCPHDGTALTDIGAEMSEQVDIIPAQVKVIEHVRKKYACPCCKEYVVTANKPKQPIEKSIAAPGLLAYVATSKYCDAMPLYRQSESFKRLGIELDRSNLANWMVRCGELVQPIINLLHDKLLERSLIHMDETTAQVLKEPDKPPQSKSYMWLMSSFTDEQISVFHYAPSRSKEIPVELLGQYSHALMVDGYEGYQKITELNGLTRLGCWAHARRKFVDAQRVQPKGKTGKADQALAIIQKLYGIEKKIKGKPNDERYATRQTESKEQLQKLKKWLDKSIVQVPPKTAIGVALHYLNNQWGRLIQYISDPTYPMDNNLAENQIRPFAIGRKNWLFSVSQAGAKASANLYSIIATAKANKLNTYDYLKQLFTDLPNANTIEDIELLLPWAVKDELG